MVKTQINKTSADKTAIGFDYQYYFFLWKILSLRTGQSIGWEVKDDVHIETDKQNYFYQIKHSVQKKNDGGTINLTTSDKDLWKTISNWVKVIVDENDGREGIDNQLLFLDKTTFILASNKSSTSKNIFLKGVAEYQDKEKNFSTIKSTVQELLKKTEDNIISGYISALLKLDDKVFKNLLRKLRFELDENDIFKKCKEAIKADKILENKIDDVFRALDSALRKDNFITITGGKKVLITFDDFYKKYRKYYDIARNDKLLIRPFDGLLPDKLEEQIFIKQILDIKDVQADDIESITEFSRFKLKLQNNLSKWLQEGEIANDEIEAFENEAKTLWRNEFRPKYRGKIEDSEIDRLALNILDEIRKRKLSISQQELETDMSNGVFYSLSDRPVIGWRNDWERKYKNED
jgi:hypothetical protein